MLSPELPLSATVIPQAVVVVVGVKEKGVPGIRTHCTVGTIYVHGLCAEIM